MTISPLNITSSQATLIQTPAPTKPDLKTRLAEQAKDGTYSLLAARAGVNDSNVLGGLRTNAAQPDPNSRKPAAEAISANNIRGGSFIDSAARLDVANYALSNPVAQDIQKNFRDTSRNKDIERSDNLKQVSKNRAETRSLQENDEFQRAQYAEDLAQQDAAQKTDNTPAPTPTENTASVSSYTSAASSYTTASTTGSDTGSNPANTVSVAV